MRAAVLLAKLSLLATNSAFGADPVSVFERQRQHALERQQSGFSIATRAPDGDGVALIRPLRSWKSVSGHFCRAFKTTIEPTSGLRTERTETACRDDDGVWRITED